MRTPVQITTLIGLFGYVIFRTKKLEGKPEQVWLGFDMKAAFSHWGEYLKFGVPAAIMICLEWWWVAAPVCVCVCVCESACVLQASLEFKCV
jgi:ABC-type dipeptide/oligopeptide/nickel transport system permease subunit